MPWGVLELLVDWSIVGKRNRTCTGAISKSANGLAGLGDLVWAGEIRVLSLYLDWVGDLYFGIFLG
jgi:hypothetical protein